MTPRKVFIHPGEIVVTIAIAEKMYRNRDFGAWVMDCLKRYISCDWGDMSEEDKAINNEAALRMARESHGRVIAKYNNKEGEIMIITDSDEEHTIIVFREERIWGLKKSL
jgi:hypothetical protein